MALLPRSLAGQAIALQVVVIALVVLAGSALALLDARHDGDEAAREQVIAIAVALADAPSTAAAIEAGDADKGFATGHRSGADEHRHRVHHDHGARPHPVHPYQPRQIGGKYLGTIEPALRGETFTEVYTGTLGPSIRAVAPVRNASGQIVGLVSAGITEQSLADRWRSTVADHRRG